MNELLTLLNLCVGLGVLGMVAVLLHKTRRIHVKLFAVEDEIRALRTTESANLYRQVQAFISLKDLLIRFPHKQFERWHFRQTCSAF